jgi:hypothetical protein
MAEEAGDAFELTAQIGTRLRYLDRRGSVSVRDGRLVLRKRKGTVIAEAPVAEVSAFKKKMSAGAAAQIRMNDRAYIVEPISFNATTGFGLDPNVARAVKSLVNIKRGRQLTEQFLSVLDGMGGTIGKGGDEAS